MYTSHPAGVKTAFRAGSRYRAQTTFADGTELLEEYDAVTQHLECRRWRATRPFGGVTDWEYEIGDPPSVQETSMAGTTGILRPSSLNPTFHPRDTRKAWEWHIRNLPYPEETYSLSVDSKKQALVLRTTNKKYYKVFQIPALCRAGLPLQRPSAKMAHNGGSTLVLSYEKPASIIKEEREARASTVKDGGAGPGEAKNKGLMGTEGRMAAPAAVVGGGEAPSECKQS